MRFFSWLRTLMTPTRRNPDLRRQLCLECLEDRLCPSSATLDFSTFLGGSGRDVAFAVAMDSAGNSYVTGYTTSADFPVTSGAFQTTIKGPKGTQEAFVAKFNPAGGLVYATYLGGKGLTLGDGIAVDQYGDAYVTGKTDASNFPVVNALQPNYGGGQSDAFVAKLNPTGTALLYSTYLGGAGNENQGASWDSPLGGIAVDSSGNAYVTGTSSSSSGFPTRNGIPQTSSTAYAFVTRIDTNLAGSASLVYSTFLGADRATAIAADNSGNAYITGEARSSDGFTPTPGAFLTSGSSGFVAKLNTNLSGSAALIYATYLGAFNIFPNAIAVDQAGNAYVAGQINPLAGPQMNSSTLTTTANAFQAKYGGGPNDAFVTVLNPAGSGLIYSTYLGGTGPDWAQAIAVDGAGHVYVTGETASGDFPIQGAFQVTNNNGRVDSFVAELDPFAATGSTSLIYASYLGGTGNDTGYGIAVDQYGDAIVVGQASTGFPTVNAFEPSYHGAFVTKIAPPQWAANAQATGEVRPPSRSLTSPGPALGLRANAGAAMLLGSDV
jgi:hypothetical protein